MAALRHADAQRSARHRREVQRDDDEACAVAPHVGEDRTRGVVAIEPLEALRFEFVAVQGRFAGVEAIQVADERRHACVRGVPRQGPRQG